MWRYIIALNVISLLWGAVVTLGVPTSIGAIGTILSILVLVGLLVFEKIRAKKGAKEIEKNLAAQSTSFADSARPDQQAEVDEMQKQFNQQLAALKKSKVGGGGASALYALPWYMIIGPPGAGKSTALRNSGLHFPSSKRGAVRGIGGTRNCDWWLTNEAVILDTAGRYATEDEDKEEWLAFLDTVRKSRKRKPINGLLVAVSITDIAGQNENAINELARQIRTRLDEVTERLQTVVPVYILFTKCDLLPGFMESFGSLRKADRGQIWGATYPLEGTHGNERQLYTERAQELSDVLRKRMYMRLEEDRRPEVRERIFQFPQQFDTLIPDTAQFIEQLFASDIYTDPPVLRGTYFSSGTQEGRPVDLLAQSMTSAFGVSPQAPALQEPSTEAKSYFLRDVFHQVLFPDQAIASQSAKGKRQFLIQRTALIGGAALTAALITILPLQAYWDNAAIVDSTRGIIDDVVKERKNHPDEVISPADLEALRDRLALLKQWEADAPPLAMRYGMYQGDTLFPLVRRFYVKMLQQELLHPIVQADVTEMKTVKHIYGFNARPSDKEYKRFFDKLKMHLLLTAPHEPNEPEIAGREREWLVNRITERWALALRANLDAEDLGKMKENVSFYLELLDNNPDMAIARSKKAVQDTRNLLNRVSYAEAVVKQIIAESSDQDRGLNVRRIMDGAVTPIASNRSRMVRGIFTRWGWEEVVKKRLEKEREHNDRWVFGSAAAGAADDKFIAELKSHYFELYVDEWKAFVDSLRIKQPTDLADALNMLRQLTRGQPFPLTRMFQAVHYNTTFPSKREKMAKGEGENEGMMARIRAKLAGSSVAKAAEKAAGGDSFPNLTDKKDVTKAFADFVAFGYAPPRPSKNGQAQTRPSVPLDTYHEELRFLRDSLQIYLDNPQESGGVIDRLQTARSTVKTLLGQMRSGSGWKPRIESLVWEPINYVSDSLVAIRGDVGRRWCSEVVTPYVQSLRGRFPLSPRGDEQAGIAEVAKFLRPKTGVLWSFYNQSLSEDILQVGSRFKFDSRLGGMVGRAYEKELLSYLERAYNLSTALFPTGGEQPSMSLDVMIKASPNFGYIGLEVGGQRFDYRGGPERWKRFRWPGSAPADGATIRVRGRGGVEDVLEFRGEWGLFRMLAEGRLVRHVRGGAFSLRWKSERYKAPITMEFRVTGASKRLFSSRGRRLRLAFGDMTPPYSIAKGSPPCTL